MKHIAFAALLLLLATQAHAQFGIKGGLNEAVLTGRVGEDATYKTYFHAGIFYEARVLGPLSIQPEVLLSLQGSQLNGLTTLNGLKTDYQTQLNYVSVPLLAKLTLGPVYVEAGPQFSYLVSANEQGTIQVRNTSGLPMFVSADQTSTDNYKRNDFALVAGLGLKLGPVVRLGGRFVAGINDINNVQFLQGVNDPQLHNRVFQFYAALQLPKL